MVGAAQGEMNKVKEKLSIENFQTEEGLKSLAKKAVEILTEEFETFAEDFNNFEKRHEEKRKKLFNGNRKPHRRTL